MWVRWQSEIRSGALSVRRTARGGPFYSGSLGLGYIVSASREGSGQRPMRAGPALHGLTWIILENVAQPAVQPPAPSVSSRLWQYVTSTVYLPFLW